MNIPEELKIPSPNWPSVIELTRDLAKHLEPQLQRAGHGNRTLEIIPENVAKALLVMATNAWRIRVKLTDSTNGQPCEEIGKDDLKKVNRYLEAIFESLSGIGMEVKDRTGDPFDYGLPETVVTAHPRPGLTKEMIIETLRPTIYWGPQIAQQGEVVIGTPVQMPENKEI
jgi:hypothetical protein